MTSFESSPDRERLGRRERIEVVLTSGGIQKERAFRDWLRSG
jgi:hypothetical protein